MERTSSTDAGAHSAARVAGAEREPRLQPMLERLLARLPRGIVVVDDRLDVAYANAAAGPLLNPGEVRVGHALPDPWAEFSLRDDVASLLAADVAFVERQISTDARVVSLAGVRDAEGRSALLLIEDVTAREQRATAERDFLTNAAHELRTPLAAIAGAVEVLQRGAKDDPGFRDRFLGHIARENTRVTRLAESLLALARVQAGLDAPRLDLVELKPLLEEIAAELTPPPDVRVDVDCPEGLTARADRELAYRALFNLALNAVAHTTAGTVSVSATRLSPEAVEIGIVDTGKGMAPEERARAFERFFRGSRGRASGFGLGLSIADEAIRVLGGHIELASEVGIGTTVRVQLPSGQVVR